MYEKGIKKKIIAYRGFIGLNKNPYLALEKKLNKLINSGELGVVSSKLLNKCSKPKKFLFSHLESDVCLLYESFPSSYGRNEDLFILLNSRKSSPRDLKKCEQWLQKEFRDLLN